MDKQRHRKAALESRAQSWCRGGLDSCGGKRRLSQHGAGCCLERYSTAGQEGSLNACLGIATARTAQPGQC